MKPASDHAPSRGIAAALAALVVVGGLLCGACSTRIAYDGTISENGEYAIVGDWSRSDFSGGYPRRVDLDFLNYQELVALSESGHPGAGTPLGDHIDHLLSTPLIDNSAWYAGQHPPQATNSKLGPVLRCATWNIEKSIHVPEAVAAIRSEADYWAMIDGGVRQGSKTWHEMLRQRLRLISSDVLFLQEMDIGVNRSGYLNAAAELADALGMNYAYATQAVEVDPVLLGLEPITNHETGKVDVEATNFFRADPERFRGCFGSAVLSRYPIKHAEVIPLKTVGYDWYHGEKEKIGFLETARRIGTLLVFDNVVTREMKIGGRHYFRVDIEVPGVPPSNTVSLINVHLEVKCQPEVRVEQMREILAYAAQIPHPVILAGDLNSTHVDVSPTTVIRELGRLVEDPTSWLSVANELLFSVDYFSMTRSVVNFTKNLHSPLAPDIPILFPNDVKDLIDEVEDFRFADGTAFDFRGDPERSMGWWEGELSNSNQKQLKGQVQTFSVNRPIGPIGYYRLDWMFVRSGLLTDPKQPDGSYRLAPHFGETLRVFNHHLEQPFSDHRPSVVDLPLNEPPAL